MSAEILGLMWVGRIMFSVCSHCGINLHHRCRGKLGLIPSRPAMRRALPVCMALSAQLRRCIWGGVNCRSMSSFLMNCLMGAEHSLSILIVGLKQMKALFVFCVRLGGGRGTYLMRVDLVFWYC